MNQKEEMWQMVAPGGNEHSEDLGKARIEEPKVKLFPVASKRNSPLTEREHLHF